MVRTKALAVLPACVALLCVFATVYILAKEYRKKVEYVDVVAPQRRMEKPALAAQKPVTTMRQKELLQKELTQKELTPKELLQKDATQVHREPPFVKAPKIGEHKSRFQVMRDELMQHELLAPVPQIRAPLIISHDLQYVLRNRKYTFQSDQRDQSLYPTPSFYRLQLLVPLRNVVAITLSTGVFPLTEFNVNEYNQWIDIDVLGTVYSIAVPVGEYTLTTIASGIQSAITAFGPPLNLFTVTLDPLTGKLTVANPVPFSLLFQTGAHVNESMWKVMGLLQEDTAVGLNVTAPGVVDLSGALAIDMFIDEVSENIDSTDNAVARIDLQKFTPTSLLSYFNPPDNGVPRYFWPIARLQYLTFRFMVKWSELLPDGSRVVKYRPYLFNDRNHTMQLTIGVKEYKSPLEDVVELDPQS